MNQRTKKIFAIFLALMLIFSMSSVSFADTTDTAEGYSLTGFGSKVGSIIITGATVDRCTEEITSYTRGSGDNVETFHQYTYNIVLQKGTSETAAVTANFTKSADAGDNCYISPFGTLMQPPQGPIILMRYARLDYTATLSGGVGTTTAYVTYNLTSSDSFAGYGKYDTYVFNYTISDSSKTMTTGDTLTVQFGDPAYAETAPESEMRFSGSGNTYTAVYCGARENYYPNTLALYLRGASEQSIKVESADINKICFLTYDSTGAATEKSKVTGTGTAYAVVSIKAAGSITINDVTTLNFEAPKEPAVAGGKTPSKVVSYLPLGQFASGTGWGSATGKFTDGFSATGVSLGALGGYIEFEFEDGITNNSNNPYGVDFVVYGNAFNGNPEAGAVQVSEDGKTWYELAGSMYYDDNFSFVGTQTTDKFSSAYTGTLNNATVEYTKGDSDITVGLKNSAGTYLIPSGTNFVKTAAWFPAVGTYPQCGTHTNTGSNVTVSHTASSLTFSGITAVPDYNTTATYAFGYADVTPNGTPTTYGNAVNPYTAYTTAKTGGDGFDLEWAVDPATKMPVNVNGKTFHYVRVYSAVLDNGQFGETSTEVCGIFTTANGQKNEDDTAAPVGRTAAPTVKYGNSKMATVTTTHGQVVEKTVSTNSYKLQVSASNTANIYINNVRAESGTNYTLEIPDTGTSIVRIVVQDGNSEPYITYFKVTKK